MNWSKQLRKDPNHNQNYCMSNKHTISSLLQMKNNINNSINNYQMPCKRRNVSSNKYKKYIPPMKISQIVHELHELQKECHSKIYLEQETQKTFQYIHQQIQILRNSFQSFTEIIVDEYEDICSKCKANQQQIISVNNEQQKITNRNSISMQMENECLLQSKIDVFIDKTNLKFLNVQQQMNELRENIELFCRQNMENIENKQQIICQCECSQLSLPMMNEKIAIQTLTKTIAKQQQTIDELVRRMTHLEMVQKCDSNDAHQAKESNINVDQSNSANDAIIVSTIDLFNRKSFSFEKT